MKRISRRSHSSSFHLQGRVHVTLPAAYTGEEDGLPFVCRPHLPGVVHHALLVAAGAAPVDLWGDGEPLAQRSADHHTEEREGVCVCVCVRVCVCVCAHHGSLQLRAVLVLQSHRGLLHRVKDHRGADLQSRELCMWRDDQWKHVPLNNNYVRYVRFTYVRFFKAVLNYKNEYSKVFSDREKRMLVFHSWSSPLLSSGLLECLNEPIRIEYSTKTCRQIINTTFFLLGPQWHWPVHAVFKVTKQPKFICNLSVQWPCSLSCHVIPCETSEPFNQPVL